MSAVKKFHEATTELIHILQNSQGELDEKISKVEEFLDRRDELVKEISPPYTLEESELGKQIIQLNARLEQLLKAEKGSIQKDIKNLQAKKQSNTKYVNPYQSLSTDGMFYDKRK
ncbi:flagellar protein FliT [Cytobacillus oceanisediminis]|uniref:flagellar protein FliT n=1 Tax=Cytobacillus oceanisediminis TaxID=665099 RepID=UPI0011AAE3E8|nr:flagellar protein FliT [Cytobacillus oceanisediminis]